MSSLASLHLRQARTFLRAGDPQRAIELLEKAKAVVRDDIGILREVLDVLASAYQQAGASDKAARCLDQLDRLGGPLRQQGHVGVSAEQAFVQSISARRAWWLQPRNIAVAVIFLTLCCVCASWWIWHRKPAAATVAVSAVEPAPVFGPTNTGVVPVAMTPSTAPLSAVVALPDDQVRQCVGLLVLMGRYEGNVNQVHLQMDIPLQSGTAFVVKRSGILLTNKHVTHAIKENNFPGSLQEWSLPTMTLREVHCVLCFGPNPDDRADATLAYESEKFDLAIMRTDRRFTTALDCSGRAARQGEDVYAWGYPGALSDLFNHQFANEPRVKQAVEKLAQTHAVDLLSECFSPESFKPTLTRGVISVAERNIDGSAYTQSDVKVSPGNSGGPMLDTSQRVIAIVTLAGKDDANGYNFALLTNQFQDEIAPYMSGD
jgi:S1-C subfamily serine protease